MRNNLFLGAAAIALIAPMAASAQETTSSIRGTVSANGAPVAGATVVILNVPSGSRSTQTTDASGSFNAGGLRVGGPFTVTVTATGYPETSITDIQTTVVRTSSSPRPRCPARATSARARQRSSTPSRSARSHR